MPATTTTGAGAELQPRRREATTLGRRSCNRCLFELHPTVPCRRARATTGCYGSCSHRWWSCNQRLASCIQRCKAPPAGSRCLRWCWNCQPSFACEVFLLELAFFFAGTSYIFCYINPWSSSLLNLIFAGTLYYFCYNHWGSFFLLIFFAGTGALFAGTYTSRKRVKCVH